MKIGFGAVPSCFFGCLRKLGKILLLLAPFAMVLTLYFAFLADRLPVFPPNLTVDQRGIFGDSFGVLTSLVSALGFAGVMVTIWMQGAQGRYLERHQRSLFKLEATKRAYEKARLLLVDGNNNKNSWIRAGRLLEHVRELAAGVTVREHRMDLEVTHLEYRPFFAELIESKPPQFFYGGPVELSIEEALLASEARIVADGYATHRDSKLDEASIYSIWAAGQFPDDYDEMLGRKFTVDDLKKIRSTLGVKQFLLHTRRFCLLAGRVHQKLSAAEALTLEASALEGSSKDK